MLGKLAVKTITQIALVSVVLVGAAACAPEYEEREGAIEREGVIEREAGLEREGAEEREVEVERD